jgi:hypothetical protein
MKKRFWITILVCVLVAAIWSGPGVGQTNIGPTEGDVDPAEVYAAIIDNAIEKCQAKSALLDSGSYHVRRIAVRASLKSAYFESHKDELVAYLVANKISLTKARVQYHLNHQFYDKVRPNDVFAEVQIDRDLID